MDRLIAANSVPLAQADTAPAAGTPQYATDGNPAANVLGTRWPSYQYNAIQEELIAILTAGGITPDRTNNAQVVAAIEALIAQPQTNKVSGVVGQTRNLVMDVAAASSSATLTADEIIVESALGGTRYCLASFNETINLATAGAGGMDTGAAPVSGFVALYAIYDPTTQTAALLATNATSAKAPEVYGGAHMPAGYTASALVSVWPTNASGQLMVANQRARRIALPITTVLSTSTGVTALTTLSISGTVPKNAIECDVLLGLSQAVSGNGIALDVFGSLQSIDGLTAEAGASSGTLTSVNIKARMMMTVAQTLYYQMQNTTAGSYAIAITGYSF